MAKLKRNRPVTPRPSGGGGKPARGGGLGMGGNNPNQLMSQMQKLQEEMEKTQAALEDEEVTVTVGGGVVTVVATGGQQIRSITIQPEAVDPDDVEMLQDMVLSAVNEALQKGKALAEERMGALTGGLGLPPGLGF
ncbi:MAG: YbaB/EbfC family nucleoid-associated protein [Caldilineaceae bacterium]